MKNTVLFYFLIATLFVGCSKDEIHNTLSTSNNSFEDGWLVPLEDLRLSETGKDRIPSIDNPGFATKELLDIDPNETVYVYREGDTIKVYPQSVISGHEIVNDKIGDNYFAISYCPLTGSALSWDREIDGTITEFGVSGHLYNDNLIPYDRNSNNMWSQMHLNRIKGNTGESKLVSNMLLTTNWRTINSSFPDALVLVDSSGHICNDSICVNPNHVSNEKKE